MKFTKMHALGNDYVYINVFDQKVEEPERLARFVSNRRYGIGSDGLVLIAPSELADLRMIMYNLDGTEAQLCGNALRSVGKYAYTRGITDKQHFTVETKSGIKNVTVFLEDNRVVSIKANIGEPCFEPAAIPCTQELINFPVTIADRTFYISSVSVGNPHCVTFIDDVDTLDIEKYGSLLEKHPLFPEKANVEFVKIIDRGNVKMRVWERGCGETFACGTGCSALCSVGIKLGLLDSRVSVMQTGGTLKIEWQNNGTGIYMESDAEFIFDGELDGNALNNFERKYEHAPEQFYSLT